MGSEEALSRGFDRDLIGCLLVLSWFDRFFIDSE
jgi:hypothetical protein